MSITAVCQLDLDKDSTFETDISSYLREASVTHGRRKSLDPINHATATIKLDNHDGRFSRKNTGFYYPNWKKGCGIHLTAQDGYPRTFKGIITNIEQDPYIGSQEVVVTAVDRLGLAARQPLKAGKFRQQPVHLILNRLLDILERGEEITNPGGENGVTTGYSVLASASLSAPDTIFFEGDYCIEAICDGSASGQGWRYDLGVAAGLKRLALFARTAAGDGAVTLTVSALNAALTQQWALDMAVTDDGWTYWDDSALTVVNRLKAYRYIDVKTQSGVALTLLTDGLHRVGISAWIPRDISVNLDAICELAAYYDEPALAALERVLATEAGGFAWMGSFGTFYGTVYARCQADRDADSTPDATFADDGTGEMYTGFRLDPEGDNDTEPVSEARVESEGDYSEEAEETTIWELSPVPLTIPASTTVKLRAEYSAPARNCSLLLSTDKEATFEIAAQADDGFLWRSGAAYPPTGGPSVDATSNLYTGQSLQGTTYRKWRPYLRFNTAVIPDGDTVAGAKLRLKLLHKYVTQAWTLEIRQPGGSTYDWGTLDASDWEATPSGLVASVASSALPAAAQWLEIDIPASAISKVGYTCFYLISSRDTGGNAPTGLTESAVFASFDYSYDDAPPELLVDYPSQPALTTVFRNYGAGADIEVTAGATDTVLYGALVKGVAYSQGAERSLVTADAPSPPDEPNVLAVEMPHQGTRAADMTAEATRLAARHDAAVDRCEIDLEELDADTLAQLKARQIDDLVTVKNIKWDHSTKVNGDFFVEGVNWRISDQGKVLTATLRLEAK